MDKPVKSINNMFDVPSVVENGNRPQYQVKENHGIAPISRSSTPFNELEVQGSKSLMDRIQEDFPRTPSPPYSLNPNSVSSNQQHPHDNSHQLAASLQQLSFDDENKVFNN